MKQVYDLRNEKLNRYLGEIIADWRAPRSPRGMSTDISNGLTLYFGRRQHELDAVQAAIDRYHKRNVIPQSERGHFGETCWRLFREVDFGWTEDEFRSHNHSGGGFYSLPTIQECDGGVIAFITEEQYGMLGERALITQTDYVGYGGYGEWQTFFHTIHSIDYLVVVPTREVERITAEYAEQRKE